MSEQMKDTQAQQIAIAWQKFVTGQVATLETVLGEVGKLQAKGAAQVVAGIEEAGRYAKESMAQFEKVSAEWRKLALDAAHKTAELLTPQR